MKSRAGLPGAILGCLILMLVRTASAEELSREMLSRLRGILGSMAEVSLKQAVTDYNAAGGDFAADILKTVPASDEDRQVLEAFLRRDGGEKAKLPAVSWEGGALRFTQDGVPVSIGPEQFWKGTVLLGDGVEFGWNARLSALENLKALDAAYLRARHGAPAKGLKGAFLRLPEWLGRLVPEARADVYPFTVSVKFGKATLALQFLINSEGVKGRQLELLDQRLVQELKRCQQATASGKAAAKADYADKLAIRTVEGMNEFLKEQAVTEVAPDLRRCEALTDYVATMTDMQAHSTRMEYFTPPVLTEKLRTSICKHVGDLSACLRRANSGPGVEAFRDDKSYILPSTDTIGLPGLAPPDAGQDAGAGK